MRRGTVRVWVKWGLPEERTLLATLGDNDFFGERALEGTDGRTASAPPEFHRWWHRLYVLPTAEASVDPSASGFAG